MSYLDVIVIVPQASARPPHTFCPVPDFLFLTLIFQTDFHLPHSICRLHFGNERFARENRQDDCCDDRCCISWQFAIAFWANGKSRVVSGFLNLILIPKSDSNSHFFFSFAHSIWFPVLAVNSIKMLLLRYCKRIIFSVLSILLCWCICFWFASGFVSCDIWWRGRGRERER